jgi:hypothetical protein
VLHRLEFRYLLFEGDALIGVAHADIEHRFKRAGDLQASRHPAHQHQRILVEALRRRLDRYGVNIAECHGIAGVAGEIEPGLDPAFGGIDQRDRRAARAACEHGDILGVLGERNTARATGQGAVDANRDAVFRARRRYRHHAFRGGHF